MMGFVILPTVEFPQIDNLKDLFLNDVPMLDVRAPVEFEHGAFPNSVNIPLMTDAEREAVGIEYKEQGQDAAISLGADLVTDPERNKRKALWAKFFNQHPNGVLYCFRGGLRSKISQQWTFDETEVKYPRVNGGYKAMRRFLIDNIERISESIPIVILGGRTGSGKTRVLNQLENSLDLEGLANHRGSAFGPTATPQPTQINFENTLAIQLLKLEDAGSKFIVIEDEGRNVGSVGIPQALFDTMKKAPIIRLEVSDDDRNQISIQEYVLDVFEQFNEICDHDTEQSHQRLSEHLLGNVEGFSPLVNTLLFDYYDPMYDYQISKKLDRIVFKGSQKAVMEYIEDYIPSYISLSFVLATPVNANGWELSKNEEGIKVFVRDIKNSPLKSFRGEMLIKGRLTPLVAVLEDSNSYVRWMHQTKSSKRLKQINQTSSYIYVVTDMPWPVMDRDSVTLAKLSQNSQNKQVTINMKSAHDYIPAKSGHFRITDMQGKWIITPQGNGMCKVIYEMRVDPGGNLPKWLVNALSVDVPFYTLNNLRREVKAPKYKDAKRSYIQD
ncbi:tRNA 2-selenouridine synthase [Nymphon striatum]|nr:tRNA 2-selenouridine synthase [Nymphon striatum]